MSAPIFVNDSVFGYNGRGLRRHFYINLFITLFPSLKYLALFDYNEVLLNAKIEIFLTDFQTKRKLVVQLTGTRREIGMRRYIRICKWAL